MTNINTNQHSSLLAQRIWELHRVKVSSSFAINLSQYVGRLRKTKLRTIATSDDLRRHSVLQEYLLEHRIVVLSL